MQSNNRPSILRLASLFAIALLSAHRQSNVVSWYKHQARAAAEPSAEEAGLTTENATTTAHLRKRRRSVVTASSSEDDDGQERSSFLLRNDSLYARYNMSTTPYVIEHYKLLFFTTEKIGSTVLKQLMRRMMNHTDYWYHGGGIPHKSPQNGLRVLTDYGLEKANEMMISESWVRAMFVRDPKERALSGYLMWRPQKSFTEGMTSTRGGMLNESHIPRKARLLGKCCRDRAGGDFNYEVLCFNHMRTFEGFLSMVEDPPDGASESNRNSNNGKNDGYDARSIDDKIRNSPSCPDKHWSPVTSYRMERKFYPRINFVGHLETAQWDIKRLLDTLHPDAWETYGASGWGEHRNESMFSSSTTVKHSTGAVDRLSEHYTKEVEERVEKLYAIDYDNEFMDLERVPIGDARPFYRKRFLERHGESTA